MQGTASTCVRLILPLTVQLLVASASFGAESAPAPASSDSDGVQESGAEAIRGYGRVPLSFEENVGQADGRVQFVSRGAGYELALAPTDLSILISSASDKIFSERSLLRIRFPGSDTKSTAQAVDPLPGRSHYYLGRDPNRWRTDIPHYRKVLYKSVYPDIDLLYYGNQGQLEFDFVLAPGADPTEISMRFDGASSLAVDRNGDLVIAIDDREIRLRKPIVYQQDSSLTGGESSRRTAVTAAYLVSGSDPQEVGFQIGRYDPGLPLVIDPVLVYSNFLGGALSDEGADLAVDVEGNAYVTGWSNGQTNRGLDAVIMKLNTAGSAISYVAHIGGEGEDEGKGIALDGNGNAYITGQTKSLDFPITTSALKPACAHPCRNAFVTKIDASGMIVYSTYLGGTLADTGTAVAVDREGNAYVTGETSSIDLSTEGAFQLAPLGGRDAFVAKLNAEGSQLTYYTYLGGVSLDRGFDIAVDGAGQAYVAGSTQSSNFPIANALQPECASCVRRSDAFVSKFSADGSQLLYSTYFGGASFDAAAGIALDAEGNVYLTGTTSSTDFPLRNPLQESLAGDSRSDAFVTKINSTGSDLVFSTYLGGAAGDGGSAIAVDSDGNAHVAGTTTSLDFPTVKPFQGVLFIGFEAEDAFVAKLTEDGSTLHYSTYLGGGARDQATGIGIDGNGDAYVAGRSRSQLATFPIVGALGTPVTALPKIFVSKLKDVDPPPPPMDGRCANVAGDWFVQETATASCTFSAGGLVESQENTVTGGGQATINQDHPLSCTFSFEPAFAAAGTLIRGPDRTGQIDGTSVLMSGPMAAPVSGATIVSTSQNSIEITGNLTQQRFLTLTGSGRFVGSVMQAGGVVNVDCSVTSSAFMARMGEPPTAGPQLPPNAVFNGASFRSPTSLGGAIAPGTIVAIFGSELADDTVVAAVSPLPTILGDTRVTFDGIPAPLLAVTPGQINALVPFEVSQGEIQMSVTRGGIESLPQSVTVARASPGIFTENQRGNGQGAVLIANTATVAAQATPPLDRRPVRRGEFISIFATGLGDVSNRPPAGGLPSGLATTLETPVVKIGGVDVQPIFSGLSGFAGLYQVNVEVPLDLQVPPRDDGVVGTPTELSLTIGGVTSNIVTISVE